MIPPRGGIKGGDSYAAFRSSWLGLEAPEELVGEDECGEDDSVVAEEAEVVFSDVVHEEGDDGVRDGEGDQ